MIMKIVDAKGQLCPQPIIMTKKALKEIEKDESLKIIVDNEIAFKNVKRFVEDNGMGVSVKQSGAVFEIFINKTAEEDETANIEKCCEITPCNSGNYVVAFQKDKLGAGSDELGEMLIYGFIGNLSELDNLPKTALFLNSGIHLVTEGSPVLASMKILEEKGVEILTCGTCLDYYDKMDELEVGKVSNMYEIMDKMSKSDKVIFP
jgi:selenium metabolism protein YedF